MKIITPELILPSETGNYKVIQLYQESQPFLRFSPQLRSWDDFLHCDIINKFLKEIEVAPVMVPSHNPYANYDVPRLPEDIHYELTGMGKCEFNLEKRIMNFFGRSIDYPFVIDRRHLDAIRKLTDFGIQIS